MKEAPWETRSVEQIMRDYWNDTFAKNYPIRFFLRAGVSSGALMLPQFERRIRTKIKKETVQ